MELALLRPQERWGDYGSVLTQGILRETGSSLILEGCWPFGEMIFPSGTFVVMDRARSVLESKVPEIKFDECILGRTVDIKWREWLDRDRPAVRPPGGEPEAYLSLPKRVVTSDETFWKVSVPYFCTIEQQIPIFEEGQFDIKEFFHSISNPKIVGELPTTPIAQVLCDSFLITPDLAVALKPLAGPSATIDWVELRPISDGIREIVVRGKFG